MTYMYVLNEYTGWEVGNVEHVFFDRKTANKWVRDNIRHHARSKYRVERVKLHG